MTLRKVVLSHSPGRPSALCVTIDLGHAFVALPRETQRAIIESRLADANEEAQALLDVPVPADDGAREVAA